MAIAFLQEAVEAYLTRLQLHNALTAEFINIYKCVEAFYLFKLFLLLHRALARSHGGVQNLKSLLNFHTDQIKKDP